MKKLLQKYRQSSPALRSSIWSTICNFLQRGTAFIVVPIFTRLLTTEQYGICNVYFAWFDIFILFTSLKLPYEGLNNGLIRHEEDKDGYTSAILGLIMVLTVAMAMLYLPLRQYIDRFTGLTPLLMVFMFLQLLFSPTLNLWINRDRDGDQHDPESHHRHHRGAEHLLYGRSPDHLLGHGTGVLRYDLCRGAFLPGQEVL